MKIKVIKRVWFKGEISMEREYQIHVSDFEEKQFLNLNKQKNIEELRDKFVSDYPTDVIKSMKIDEYINGKGDRSTFCNRIETELKDLGNMKGGIATKFGVYYGKFGEDTDKEYRFVKRFGNTVDQAFNTIKMQLVKLIEAGATKDFDKINKNLLSPMLKGKV